jgi:hypothetical protein
VSGFPSCAHILHTTEAHNGQKVPLTSPGLGPILAKAARITIWHSTPNEMWKTVLLAVTGFFLSSLTPLSREWRQHGVAKQVRCIGSALVSRMGT